jgi:type III secretion protein U
MAEQNDGGDKTELPTEKRLREARKKGDVPKSKEITTTLTLLVWLGLGAMALPLVGERITALTLGVLDSIRQPFSFAAPAMGWMAIEVVLWVTGLVLVPVILVGLAVEFLQAGPVFTTEKVKPKLENLDPVAGVKKMFGIDNLVEVLKAVVKTVLLFFIGWIVIKGLLPQIALLSTAEPALIGTAMWQVMLKLLGWTLAVFAMVSVLDIAWQRHSFTKKMRMSLRDIRQEMKESEGDPHVKSHRRQTQQEWAQRNAANAAANANVLVVNPTHVAIAIDYDRETCPVPTLSAKGEDEVALAMREAALAAGVPVVRNIPLARDMLVRAEVGEIVPQDLFEVMAEVILWAREVREQVQAHTDPLHPGPAAGQPGRRSARRRAVPGEDLTRYPDGFRRQDD